MVNRKTQENYWKVCCRVLEHEAYGKFALVKKTEKQYLEEFDLPEGSLDNPNSEAFHFLKKEFKEAKFIRERKGRNGQKNRTYESSQLCFTACYSEVRPSPLDKKITSIRIRLLGAKVE